jgi:hypothetical protein
MNGYYWARRKRDGVLVILWVFRDASGIDRCSCARTQGPMSMADFDLLGGVAPLCGGLTGDDGIG